MQDLVSSAYFEGRFVTLLGNGNGTFRNGNSYTTAPDTSCVLTQDVNADGKIDVIAGSNTTNNLTVFLNTSNGAFASAVTYSAGIGIASDLISGDFNLDGLMDLAVNAEAPSYTHFGILLGNKDGSFSAARTFDTGSSFALPLSVSDLNGDGRPDIVLVADSPDYGAAFLGNGDGSFRRVSTFSPINGSDPNYLAVGDLNKDGAPDAVVAGYTTSVLEIFFGNTAQTSAMPYLNLGSAAFAREAMSTIDETFNRITTQRGSIGAVRSRLASAMNTLETMRINSDAANSRITDIDVAEELAGLIQFQIRQQTASSVLSQANQLPRLALELLT